MAGQGREDFMKREKQRLTNMWVAVALLFLGSSLPVFAQSAPDGLRLGDPRLGGTGCPQGSVSTVLSPDGQSLSLIFEQFSLEVGGTTGRKTDQKFCHVGVPIK